jgi:uncharacterized membrane protein
MPVEQIRSENPGSTATIAGHPIHPMLVPIPLACFIGTFLTDLVYVNTYDMQWANISAWFLSIGLIVAFFAVIAGLIDFFGERRIRNLRAAWIHAIGNAVALILAIFNLFIHTRDAYTSVYPAGITLSGIVVLILLVTGWNGWSMVYRHGVAVRGAGQP